MGSLQYYKELALEFFNLDLIQNQVLEIQKTEDSFIKDSKFKSSRNYPSIQIENPPSPFFKYFIVYTGYKNWNIGFSVSKHLPLVWFQYLNKDKDV